MVRLICISFHSINEVYLNSYAHSMALKISEVGRNAKTIIIKVKQTVNCL